MSYMYNSETKIIIITQSQNQRSGSIKVNNKPSVMEINILVSNPCIYIPSEKVEHLAPPPSGPPVPMPMHRSHADH